MIRSGMTKRLRRWRGNLNVNLVSRWWDKILISSLKETFKSNVWSDLNAMKKCPTFIKQAKTIRIQYEEEQGLGTLNSCYHLTILKVANNEETSQHLQRTSWSFYKGIICFKLSSFGPPKVVPKSVFHSSFDTLW